MPQIFVIDQAATFDGVAFLKAVPRLAFGTQDQDRTADGTPKWDVSLIAGFNDSFGRAQHEVIKVGIASATEPGQGMGQYTPVQLVNFVVGVVPPEVRKDARGQEKLVGGTTWYRADEIRPVGAQTGGRKTAATEG